MHILKDEQTAERTAIVFGGGHYNQAANKIMQETNIAVGHICAKFLLETLTEETIKEAIEKHTNKIDLVIVDWKGLGQYKQHIVDLFNKMNIDFERVKNIIK